MLKQKEKYQVPKGMYIVFLSIAIVWAIVIPRYLDVKTSDRFATPLLTHELPADARMVQRDAARTDDGGWMAAMILQTGLDETALREWFSDTEYPPAKEGETVTFTVRPLDEASMDALKQSGEYTEGAEYWFVYIYSAK